jgi:uncharacterized membrane protein
MGTEQQEQPPRTQDATATDPEPGDQEPGDQEPPAPDPEHSDPEHSDPEQTDEKRWAAFAPSQERPPGRLRRAAATIGRGLTHEWALASLGSLAVAVIMTWPALRYPRYTLPHDLGDPTLVAWILAWPGHALLTDPVNLWHGNAFFPERWSFAFTDSLLGYAPFSLLGSGPADAMLRYNILFVLAHALAFLGGYALVRQLGAGRFGGIAIGIAFAYAPWRLAQGGHLHVLSTGGIALALAMLARGHGWSLRHGFRPDQVRPGWIVAGWLVAAWQVSLGFGVGLPFAYALGVIALAVATGWMARRVMRRRRQSIMTLMGANLIGGSVFAAAGLLLALPYLIVADLHPHARRSLTEVAFFSPPVQGFFTAPPESWLWGELHAGARESFTAPAEMTLLPGFTLLALAIGGLLFSVWSLRARLALAGGVLVLTVLAMGTEFFDGVVYRQLYQWLPGWDALRTPGRLIIWITLLLGVLAAGTLTALATRARHLASARGSTRPGLLLRALVGLPVVLMLVEGLNTTPHPVMPPQPQALAAAEGPVLVLPSDEWTDSHVMLWTTDRFPAMVNGASGFMPQTLAETRQVTASFPDASSVSFLRSLGVETVVVLADRVIGTEWESALVASGEGLGIVREEVDRAVVFHLNP